MYRCLRVTQHFRISSVFQFAIALLVLSFLVVLSACSSSPSSQSNSNNNGNSGGSGGAGGNSGGGGTTTVSVSVSGSPNATAGGTSTYTATVQNSTNQAVTWQVNGGSGNSTVGTITSGGVYTAPVLPPSGGTVTITAVSQADSTKSASTTVTIQYSNASIQGAYVFAVNGAQLGGSFSFSSAGSFQADGKGNLSGVLDYATTTTALPLTGTYTVGTDGRGSATFTTTQESNVYHFAVLQTGQLQLVGFDNHQVTTGLATFQDQSALSLNALAGNWVFQESGGTGMGYVVTVGQFTLDAPPQSGAAGDIPQGEFDTQIAGTSYSAETFTIGESTPVNTSTGRAEISWQTQPGQTPFCSSGLCLNLFFYYVVSSTEIVMPGGIAYKQQGGPFSLANFTGSYVFALAGVDSAGHSTASVGQVTATHCGSVTGSADANDDGLVALSQTFSAVCSPSIAANGRGTLAVDFTNGTVLDFVFYIVSPTLVEFIEADRNGTVNGPGITQSGGPFSNASISGSFGLVAEGNPSSSAPFDFVGTLKSSGSQAGTLDGTEDVNSAGTLQPGIALTGTYTVANPQIGRGTAAISGNGSTSNVVFYVVQPGHALFLDVDSTEVAEGSIDQQY